MKNALALSTPVAGTSITVSSEMEETKAKLLANSKEITAVQDCIGQELAVDACKEIKRVLSLVEDSRVAVKAPVLDLGRAIDGAAKRFCSELEAEATRLNKCITAFQIEERQRAEEAERQRLAELRRIEQERLEAERQERLRREEAERAEAAKRKAEEDAFAATGSTKEQELEQAAQAEAKRQQEAAAAAEAQRKQQEELAKREAAVRSSAVTAPTIASGMQVREVWTFEVTDVWELANRGSRDLVRLEPNVAAINRAIAAGMRACPGLRIYKEVKTGVRV